MHSYVEVSVLMEMSFGEVSRFGPGISVLGGGGCAPRGRGSFGGLKSCFGFQIPIDYNGTRTMGGGKCFSRLMSSLSRMIGEPDFWCFRCTLMEDAVHPNGKSGFLMVCQLLKEGLVYGVLCQRVCYFLCHWFERHSLVSGSIGGSANDHLTSLSLYSCYLFYGFTTTITSWH